MAEAPRRSVVGEMRGEPGAARHWRGGAIRSARNWAIWFFMTLPLVSSCVSPITQAESGTESPCGAVRRGPAPATLRQRLAERAGKQAGQGALDSDSLKSRSLVRGASRQEAGGVLWPRCIPAAQRTARTRSRPPLPAATDSRCASVVSSAGADAAPGGLAIPLVPGHCPRSSSILGGRRQPQGDPLEGRCLGPSPSQPRKSRPSLPYYVPAGPTSDCTTSRRLTTPATYVTLV
jgi:hypothetical protein